MTIIEIYTKNGRIFKQEIKDFDRIEIGGIIHKKHCIIIPQKKEE